MKTVCIKFICVLLCAVVFGCSSFLKKERHTDNPALRSKITTVAARYLGTPYKYGGRTPAGFDCSGFTSYVFKKTGINIPRTSSAQYRSGCRVSKSDLRKGDLLFFTRWGFIGKLLPSNHVGVYVGSNKFVHAPSKGGCVRYDSLNNSYWRGRLKGARDFTGE